MAALDNKRIEFALLFVFFSLIVLSIVFTVALNGPIMRGAFALVFLGTLVGWVAIRGRDVHPAINLWFVGMLLLAGGGLFPSTVPVFVSQICFGIGFCLIVLAHFRMRRQKRE